VIDAILEADRDAPIKRQNVAEFRRERALTQEEVAHRAEVNR